MGGPQNRISEVVRGVEESRVSGRDDRDIDRVTMLWFFLDNVVLRVKQNRDGYGGNLKNENNRYGNQSRGLVGSSNVTLEGFVNGYKTWTC